MDKGDFRDFDAMLAEMEGETLCFQLFGRRYRMKKRLPAAIVLKLARAEPDQRVEAELLAQAAQMCIRDSPDWEPDRIRLEVERIMQKGQGEVSP